MENGQVLEGALIRRYYITNTTDHIIFLNLRLYPLAEKPKSLFRLPSMTTSCVKPNCSSQIFAYVKILAEQEWEEMQYSIDLQFVENKQSQQYGGYDNRNYKDDDYGNYGRNIPAAPKLNLKLETTGPIDGGFSTMKSCKYCSNLNDINNQICRTCNREL